MERIFSVWKFRLGISDYLSKNPVFSGNFPLRKTKLAFPFTFQLKFPDLWINGKQPQNHSTSNGRVYQVTTYLLLLVPVLLRELERGLGLELGRGLVRVIVRAF